MSSLPQQLDPPAPDGDRRDTDAGSAEAPAPAGLPERSVSWISRLSHRTHRGRRALLALLGFLIATLVVPAATKQWSDRSSELALKKELVSQINTTVTKAVAVIDCTTRLSTCFPEGRAVRGGSVSDDSMTEADVAYGKTLVEAKTDWNAEKAAINSVVDAYFAGTPAEQEWVQHAEAVSAFIRLSSTECGEPRDDDTRYLQAYLPETNANVWILLGTNIGPDCSLTSPEFEAGYAVLAEDLTAQTPRVTRAVIDANANGYSSGARDFLRDLWPL